MTIMNCTFIRVFFQKMFFFGQYLHKSEFHINHFYTYDQPQNGRSDWTQAKKAILGADPKMVGSTQNGRFDQKWSIGPGQGGVKKKGPNALNFVLLWYARQTTADWRKVPTKHQ